MLAAKVQGGVAAPYGTPSQHQQSTKENNLQEVNLENFADLLLPVLPEITPLALDFLKEMNERQLSDMETMIPFLMPIVRAIIKSQAGADGISQKEDDLLHEVESYVDILTSFIQKRKEKVIRLRKPAVLTIPDYTDMVYDHTPVQDIFFEIDTDFSDVSLESVQMEDNTPVSQTLQYNPIVYNSNIQDKQSYHRANVSTSIEKVVSRISETSTSLNSEERLPHVEGKHKHKYSTPYSFHIFFKPPKDNAENRFANLPSTNRNITSDSLKQSTSEYHTSATPTSS